MMKQLRRQLCVKQSRRLEFVGIYCISWDTTYLKAKRSRMSLVQKEELESWPEQSLRQRSWLTIPEAVECCRHPWMREALEEGFLKWHGSGMIRTMNTDDED
nr:nudix hydrolase 16, mitochondrial-like [Ipomoea batatas]